MPAHISPEEGAVPSIHCFVSGRVQGVFFRAATREEATRLGLTGWVRNLPDGRVEVRACGAEDPLAALQQWLWQGPPLAHVQHVACSKVPDQVHEGFTLRH
jgi:acylphosphatase